MELSLTEVRKQAMVLLLTREQDDPDLRELLDEEERLSRRQDEQARP